MFAFSYLIKGNVEAAYLDKLSYPYASSSDKSPNDYKGITKSSTMVDMLELSTFSLSIVLKDDTLLNTDKDLKSI